MGLTDSWHLTPAGADVALAAILLVMTATAAYCWWSLRGEARGRQVHGHSDGTVHEHFRGSRRHQHPTLADRHEQRLTVWFGPADGAPSPTRGSRTPLAD